MLRDLELESIRKICLILDKLPDLEQRQRVVEYTARRAGRVELNYGPLFPTNGQVNVGSTGGVR